MHSHTLLLSASMIPHQILSWQAAVTMWYEGLVDVLAEYEDEISSPSITIKVPAVLVLRRRLPNKKKVVKFSKGNVHVRDGHRCMYCGDKLPASALTKDHVIPKSRGGRMCFENALSACAPCNRRKDCRTPEEAGMRPRKLPVKPAWLPTSSLYVDRRRAPAEWLPYLPPETARMSESA